MSDCTVWHKVVEKETGRVVYRSTAEACGYHIDACYPARRHHEFKIVPDNDPHEEATCLDPCKCGYGPCAPARDIMEGCPECGC